MMNLCVFGENSHFTDIGCLKSLVHFHDYLTFYCPETVNQILKIILTPPIVIPSMRAMYGFLHPPI